MNLAYSSDYHAYPFWALRLNFGKERQYVWGNKHPDDVAELIVVLDGREAEHSGYCSDPNSDVGEWEYDVQLRYFLWQFEYDEVASFITHECFVDLAKMKYLVPAQQSNCGYCGYVSDYVVKLGILRPTLSIAQSAITRTVLVLVWLDFPAHCLLAILEHSHPYIKYMNQTDVIRVIEGVRASRLRCLEQR